MFRFLHFKNWSQLLDNNSDFRTYIEHKRNVLFSQFCIIAMVASLVQAGYDLWEGYPMVAGIDLLIGLVLLTGYLLNEKGRHLISKILIFLLINLMLFAFAGLVPKGVGMFLLYLPVISFAFVAFDYSQRAYTYAFVALSLALIIILLITDFKPFGDINLQPIDPTISFIINFFLAVLLISAGTQFLIRINRETENKLYESLEESQALAKELDCKNKELEKTNKELDRFVYSSAHDLRSPLASVLGLINLIKIEKEAQPAEADKYLTMMEERIHNLDGFIQDIIDYSRNARTELNYSEVDITELLNEVLLNNKYLQNADRVTINTEININRPVITDRNRLLRIVNNLVSNAIKYNDYSKAEPRVDITCNANSKHLFIIVSDTGTGIDDHIKEHVFKMFYRGSEKATGSGLGLYITHEMVAKLNGTLTFETRPGEGTTFTVMLPLRCV